MHMGRFQRSPEANRSVWGILEDLFRSHVHVSIVSGLGYKIWNDVNGDRMRLTECKSRKKMQDRNVSF